MWFDSTGDDLASWSDMSRDPATGNIVLRVYGYAATDIDGDDMVLHAHINVGAGTYDIGHATVIVETPSAVTGDNDFGYVAFGVNAGLNDTTQPALHGGGVLHPKVLLVTMYIDWLLVRVLNQFGTRLVSLYAGTGVEEDIGAGFQSINAQLDDDSDFVDPVGPAEYDPMAPKVEPTINSPGAQAWLTGAQQYGAISYPRFQQTIPIRIAGHVLANGINRFVTVTAAPDGKSATLSIEWVPLP